MGNRSSDISMENKSVSDAEKLETQEAENAKRHCRNIKAMYERTKGGSQRKTEQSTSVPMSFWRVLEQMLTDESIRADLASLDESDAEPTEPLKSGKYTFYQDGGKPVVLNLVFDSAGNLTSAKDKDDNNWKEWLTDWGAFDPNRPNVYLEPVE